ncbi:MAG: hydroxyacylglutathione hydrolase [Moraxellaceae bacterium]
MSPRAQPLPAFHDNYIWCIAEQGQALVVDPGDPVVVESWLQAQGLKLAAILVTHHHADHTAGLAALKAAYKPVIYGPDENIANVEHILKGGEKLDLGVFGSADVIATPGHTRAHISYHLPASGLLFCGDTLFSAGCGRLFEGTAAQLHQSLQTLAALPDKTWVCCTHEYTEANLRFAAATEPDNPAREHREAEVRDLRRRHLPSLPVELGREKTYNPFLRCEQPALLAVLKQETGAEPRPGAPAFAALRAWKDRF